jgi:Transposase, Mutator family
VPDTTSPACRPRLRQQTFDTAIIERYRRRQRSVEEALIEMYLAGVSVRRVEDIMEALWGMRVSHSTVSDLNKKITKLVSIWTHLSSGNRVVPNRSICKESVSHCAYAMANLRFKVKVIRA